MSIPISEVIRGRDRELALGEVAMAFIFSGLMIVGTMMLFLHEQTADTLGWVAEQKVDGVVIERHKLSKEPRTESVWVGSGRHGYRQTTGVWVREPNGTDRLLDMGDGTTLTRIVSYPALKGGACRATCKPG